MRRAIFSGLVCLLPFWLSSPSQAAVLQIKPYAQWTFDTPIEKIIYREGGSGFPLKLLLTKESVILFDSTGNQIREIFRSPEDDFLVNQNHRGFVLVQKHPANEVVRQEKLYSFQVFEMSGNPKYTTVRGVDLLNGELMYQFTNDLSILQTEIGSSRVLEMDGEDTVLTIRSCRPGTSRTENSFVLANKLNTQNEIITAASCKGEGDTAKIELQLWNHDEALGMPIKVSGELKNIHVIAETDYLFLEINHGAESSLTLFNRSRFIKTFPWKSWKIEPVDEKSIFVVTENDFIIVNLGDGSIAARFHPIDMSTVSDATYLPEWGIFLYIRYEPYFREDGRQAYRKFELEVVSKVGRIAHRSSFGTWSYSLPEITHIGRDIFAVHIYNAVLMYRIETE